ncbi:ribosome small subunit-dependent GTPase A [Limnochorda pilosa]|uniref:ribosome small subunit-dependent GTPase A n=1 Tax=Limnochorda pilosa TaxID=1555112 RepID=UPI00082BEE14|nr:ribosome small subunit-dependent GTPase A [Limnochorda pilosa]
MGRVVSGRVVEVIAGFYRVVLTGDGPVLCRARGRLKGSEGIHPGDRVQVMVLDAEAGTGRVEEVLPRRSFLARPPIANVDRVVIVTPLARPRPQSLLLDRLLVLTLHAGLEPLLCWTKADLEPDPVAPELVEVYRAAGFRTVVTSALSGQGMDGLVERLEDGVAVLAGPSGAGKSALLNRLAPGATQQTAEVSRRTGRGRHTTRSARLWPVGGGWLADTPGFSRLDLPAMDPRELAGLYPEFEALAGACRFQGCMHATEPGCAVREAAQAGGIPPLRYQQYRRLLDEVEEAYRNRYR